MKPGSDKNRFKSGRSKKKVEDRKGFSRQGHGVSGGSPMDRHGVDGSLDPLYGSAMDVIKRHSNNAGPLFQRLLSAIVLEDGMEEFDVSDEIGQGDDGYADSEVEVLFGVSSHGLSSNACQYDQMCLDDRLMLELQSIGLYIQTVGRSEKHEGPLGGAAVRGNSVLGGAKEKRSQRVRKGNTKPKPKPKQKLSMSGNGLMEIPSPASGAVNVVPKTGIDIPIQGELGSDLGGNHDLSSWFNFDDEGLEEDDSVGLDIPMDDLAQLMF